MDVDEELNFLWIIFREPDLMTAAKMVLHDLQRVKIPFFVPPSQQEEGDPSEKSDSPDASEEPTISTDRTAAAMKVVAGIMSSQQLMHVPAHKDFFNGGETETEKIEHPQEDVSQL